MMKTTTLAQPGKTHTIIHFTSIKSASSLSFLEDATTGGENARRNSLLLREPDMVENRDMTRLTSSRVIARPARAMKQMQKHYQIYIYIIHLGNQIDLTDFAHAALELVNRNTTASIAVHPFKELTLTQRQYYGIVRLTIK
jgi:hypothetical protein